MTTHLRPLALVAALAAALSACGETPTEAPSTADLAVLESAGHGQEGAARYEVTVTNLTGGQPFTPPLAVTHRSAVKLFRPGRPASPEIQQIAENGNLDPMLARLEGSWHVGDVVVAAGDPPPLLPGASITFAIESSRGARRLSLVSMLICTNDGFTGVSGMPLPRRMGRTVSTRVRAWDAGTEINTEDFEDLVPPCPALTGVPSTVPGTGTSNPALAEGGVVRRHPGIQGVADLVPSIHGWTNPVAVVSVTRVG